MAKDTTILKALTCVRVNGTLVMPGKKFEVEDKHAESLIRLKAAELPEENEDVIEADYTEAETKTLEAIAAIVTDEQKAALKAAGFETLGDFEEATKATLTAVEGVGDATADKILKALEA